MRTDILYTATITLKITEIVKICRTSNISVNRNPFKDALFNADVWQTIKDEYLYIKDITLTGDEVVIHLLPVETDLDELKHKQSLMTDYFKEVVRVLKEGL